MKHNLIKLFLFFLLFIFINGENNIVNYILKSYERQIFNNTDIMIKLKMSSINHWLLLDEYNNVFYFILLG